MTVPENLVKYLEYKGQKVDYRQLVSHIEEEDYETIIMSLNGVERMDEFPEQADSNTIGIWIDKDHTLINFLPIKVEW